MSAEKPVILLSNDDGYDAKGLAAVIEAVKPLGEIVVLAPDGPRSGVAGAITRHVPLTTKLVRKEDNVTIYKCNGMPVDCIKLGLETVVPRKPKLIISGVNHGENVSINIHYSGTMGVVLEGCMKGVPSIGFSLDNPSWNADFSATVPIIRKIAQKVLEEGLSEGTCLNVNFPNTNEYKGIKVCRQGRGVWDREYEERTHPLGYKYYWATGHFVNYEPDAEDTDKWAIGHGYVSITPQKIDATAYEEMKKIEAFNITL